MQTNTTYSSPADVDSEETQRRIAEMYRDVANELAEELQIPTGRPLAEAPRLPAALRPRHELAHRQGLRPRPRAAAPRLTVEQQPPFHITSIERNHSCLHI